ncbi:hypothetical protein LCGC14_0547470 [marine sediment metagenome]|uniref:Uncharacterized protein n=1 Tax=marine sediment metagenome TaxID=412755 RepID=A0A0F9RVT3_9ZZZZ
MLELKFKVSCNTCKKSIEVLIDWSEVTLDLNSKRINLPIEWPLRNVGWAVETYYDYHGGSEDNYFCKEHKKDAND